jgi:formylglycine-generating enzyme required for sulfatase activity
MAFDLSVWKERAAIQLRGIGDLLTRTASRAPYAVYASLCTLTLWPLVEASRQGELLPAMLALGGVAASVGGNLIANQIQAWKDKADDEAQAAMTTWVSNEASNDEAVRSALDDILTQLETLQTAQDLLTRKQRATLQQELRSLGNWTHYEATLTGSGAIAQGTRAQAVGQGGVLVNGSMNGNINIGNQRKVRARTYIEKQVVVDRTKVNTNALRTAYLHHVFEHCQYLSLAGIDPKAKGSATEARLNLAAIYTALRTVASEAFTDRANVLNDETLHQRMGRLARKASVVARLNAEPRLVLLGDPGSGKSTFVDFVALCLTGEALGHADVNLALLTRPLPIDEDQWELSSAAGNKKKQPKPQPWRHSALLPVKVVLRDFAARGLPPADEPANADHLWRFIEAELSACSLQDYAPLLRRELMEQGGLLLLDGLDEVPESGNQQRRSQIKQAVEDFNRTFLRCRMLVTSRTYAYQKQDWRLQGFTELVLAPFERPQIRTFVEHWYDHVGQLRGLAQADARGRAELLKQAILGNPRLYVLAERPLLLTLMASLHAWRGGNLPEKREELYADTVDLLLDWWESPKTVLDAQGRPVVRQPSLAEWLKVDRDRVRGLLNTLAFQAHASQPEMTGTANVREGDLVSGLMKLSQNAEVNPARLVEYLSDRAGLLVPHGVGVCTFPHRTLQEYLAACYLTDHDYPERVARLVRQDLNRWREAALLAGAKAARGTAAAIWLLVEELCPALPGAMLSEQDSWAALIAGQALVETADLGRVARRDEAKRERVRDWQVRLLTGDLPPVERALAGRTLAVLGDPRPGVGLRPDGVPDIDWVLIPDDSEFIYGDGESQTKLRLPAYQISRYPITYAQFQAFVDAPDCFRDPRWWKGLAADEDHRGAPGEQRFKYANHPRDDVSWYDAVAFSRWLSDMLGTEVSLPSEQQWEKAARGPSTGSGDGRAYPWGNKYIAGYANIDETVGNVGPNYLQTSSAVGMYPQGASPYGLLDMSGNVWEWCLNEYSKPSNEQLSGDDGRVLRGGSWCYAQGFARCAYRLRLYPAYRDYDVGFRVVVRLALFSSSAL